MSLASLLTQRATIERWARTVDDYGEIAPSWSSSSTDVPCLIQQKNGRIAMSPEGREYEFSAVAYFRPGTDIKPQPEDGGEGDRIVVDSGTFEVRGVADEAGKVKMLTAFLQRR